MDTDLSQVGMLAIRVGNAVLWTFVVIRVMRRGTPLPRLVRNLSATVLFIGMWVLAFGGLTQFDLVPGEVARFVYTVFTAYAGIVALAIVTTDP